MPARSLPARCSAKACGNPTGRARRTSSRFTSIGSAPNYSAAARSRSFTRSEDAAMLSVRRLRELFSSLRSRLVIWITLVVFAMVLVTNIGIREVEMRTLRHSYDQFLIASLEEVNNTLIKYDQRMHQTLTPEQRKRARDFYQGVWKDKVRANEHRAWFLQLFDE